MITALLNLFDARKRGDLRQVRRMIRQCELNNSKGAKLDAQIARLMLKADQIDTLTDELEALIYRATLSTEEN